MAGFGMLAAIAMIIGGFSLVSLKNVGNAFHEVADVRMPSVEGLQTMEYGFEHLQMAQRTLLNPSLNEEDRKRNINNLKRAREIYGAGRDLYEPLPQTEEEAVLWNQFLPKLAEWHRVNEEFEDLLDEVIKIDLFYPMQFLKDFSQFQGDHYQLQVQIVNAIQSGRVFNGGDDYTACRLGQYLPTLETGNPVVKKAVSDLQEPHKRFHEAVVRVKQHIRNGNRQLAQQVYNTQMLPAADLVFRQFDLVIEEAQRAVDLFAEMEQKNMDEARLAQGEAIALLQAIVKMNKDIAQETTAAGDATIQTSNLYVMLIIAAGLIFAIFFALLITRNVLNDVGGEPAEIAKISSDIADGNLTYDFGDVTRLKGIFGAVASLSVKLKAIITNIMNGADNIAAASQQMSSGSQQMSQGASEQASSAEEVSSSMEEMAANIQQNTDNARQTETIAVQATQGIKESSDSTNVAVDTMRNIADKITIINDIAF